MWVVLIVNNNEDLRVKDKPCYFVPGGTSVVVRSAWARQE